MEKLIKLEYEYNEFDDVIDAITMEIHHTKHHNAYVSNYNNAIEGTEYENLKLEDVISQIESIDSSIQTAIRNNGGGISNHNLYFTQFKRDVQLEEGLFKEKLNEKFGSKEELLELMVSEGLKRFGSGWVWLVKDHEELKVISSPNQDSPIMQGMKPIIGIDVWEHAYYLKYQNRRAEYLNNIVNILDWKEIENRFLDN